MRLRPSRRFLGLDLLSGRAGLQGLRSSATLTASGRFVVLGLPVGPATLTVREDGVLVDGGLALHVVEDGVTSLPFLTLSP